MQTIQIELAEPVTVALAPPDIRPLPLGSRRELFVDRLLIDRLDNSQLRLHEPVIQIRGRSMAVTRKPTRFTAEEEKTCQFT